MGSPSVQSNTLMVIANRLRDYAGEVFKQRKPWTEVVDKNAFSKPQNLAEVRARLPAAQRAAAALIRLLRRYCIDFARRWPPRRCAGAAARPWPQLPPGPFR